MTRSAEHPIDPWFLERWSPRAMSGQVVEEATLRRLFEAARWSPSSANQQPWRFAYAQARTPAFDRFFDLLVEGNRPWCARAGALLALATRNITSRGEPARTAQFDAGAAWMALALQGSRLGLVVHAMAGFDHDRARVALDLPDDLDLCCMIAVGHPGSLDDLPERFRPRELPSARSPQAAFTAEGSFSSFRTPPAL
ncbi:MAG: nitroreductase family protein [Polyangiaceae bacterium]|jgi:nitroreductase|nr:nitroreductase family protein [Polyangiaceae bacterium]